MIISRFPGWLSSLQAGLPRLCHADGERIEPPPRLDPMLELVARRLEPVDQFFALARRVALNRAAAWSDEVVLEELTGLLRRIFDGRHVSSPPVRVDGSQACS